MNTVTLIGRLGADPTPPTSENAPASFSLAVPQRGNRDEADWFDVAAFGRLGEVVVDNLAQGRQVAVRGRLVQDKWTTSTGEKRSRVKIIASEIDFLAKARGSGADEEAALTAFAAEAEAAGV